MQDLIGRTLGHYRIVEKIGEGGMGEVYRALDERLDRDVAVKVLPEAVAEDVQRLARFEREAKLLASLSHQNVATLHGLEVHDGQRFLVMELAEGETLADRIKKGPIVVEDALEIARQIAEGLEAAHEYGIIHRDLKPANVMVSPEGKVKVLDFGLAKAFEPEGVDPDQSRSPTLTARATQMGVILGTAAYMSPEQARGMPVDKRADVWAFGCVLYEMLTGRRPFSGSDVTETLAAVLRDDPDWETLPEPTPRPIRRLLLRCLEKSPARRLRDLGDARLDLEEVSAEDDGREAEPAGARAGAQTPGGRRILIGSAVLAAAALGAGVTAMVLNTDPPVATGEVVRSSIVVPALEYGAREPVVEVSPDGRTLVYEAPDRLYRRELSQLSAKPIPGTEGARQPFFSPDGRWIGFVDRLGNLRKVSTGGEAPITILSWPPGQIYGGLSWGNDGQILVSRFLGGLYRVSADGGTPEPVTALGADDRWHVGPKHLPDGNAVLFTIMDVQGDSQVALFSFETGQTRRLVSGSSPRYLSSGHLVFSREATLWAAPFDVKRLDLTGEPVAVLEDVGFHLATAHFSVGGPKGSLAYARQSDFKTELRWINRKGGHLEAVGVIDGLIRTFGLDRDDRLLAYESPTSTGNLWIYDTERGVTTQLLRVGADPNWSPDGSRVAFAEGYFGRISAIPSDGGAPVVLFERPEDMVWLDDWSMVGDRLAVHVQGPPNQGVVVSANGRSEPIIFDEADELDQIEFSPDGRWIAYHADHGTGLEAYVMPFPPTGERIQVSSGGGVQARWRHDGKELFYLSLDGTLMAVSVDTTDGFYPGKPTPLFQTGLAVDGQVEQYAVASDGIRFLVPTPVGPSVASLVLVQNWFEELKRLVPTE